MVGINKISYSAGYLLGYLIPNRINSLTKELYRLFYTGIKSHGFKEFGTSSKITPPVRLFVGLPNIKIGRNTVLGKFIQLTAWQNHSSQQLNSSIIIGDDCSIGDFSHITAIDKIIIGDNVLTGKNVLITDNAHGKSSMFELDQSPLERSLYSKGPVIIEDNVWIGEKASILPGVHIGKGSIIGANSVVTKSFEPYSLIAGNPARLIKKMLHD